MQGMNPKLNRRARRASCKRAPFYGVARQEKVADDIAAIVARLRPALSSHRGDVICWRERRRLTTILHIPQRNPQPLQLRKNTRKKGFDGGLLVG